LATLSDDKTEATIDRATLYELVWSKPTAYLAILGGSET
jgi:hypothetical protein